MNKEYMDEITEKVRNYANLLVGQMHRLNRVETLADYTPLLDGTRSLMVLTGSYLATVDYSRTYALMAHKLEAMKASLAKAVEAIETGLREGPEMTLPLRMKLVSAAYGMTKSAVQKLLEFADDFSTTGTPLVSMNRQKEWADKSLSRAADITLDSGRIR